MSDMSQSAAKRQAEAEREAPEARETWGGAERPFQKRQLSREVLTWCGRYRGNRGD